MEEIYNGFTIRFNKYDDQWETTIKDGEKNNETVTDKSLKKLKEFLDRLKRSKFERVTVFIRTDSYRYGGGFDEKFEPFYTEAVMTSVSPTGQAFIVPKGEKSAKKFSLSYRDTSIIEDTPANRALIAEYETSAKIEWEQEHIQKKIEAKLKTVNGQKLYKSVYGKDL